MSDKKVLRKTTRTEFLFQAPNDGLAGSSPRLVQPNRASIESSISSSEPEATHSNAAIAPPILSDAAAAAPALAEARRFVLELPPSEVHRVQHQSQQKRIKEKVDALHKFYNTGTTLAKLDEVTSSKHLQSDGFTEAQATEVQDALTSQVTVFSKFRSFATLNDLLHLVISNAALPREELCERLRAYRSGSRTGLPSLCDELIPLTAAQGRLEKYAYLSDLAEAVLDMKLGATEPEKQAERERLRTVFSKAAAARNAESSHSGERSQPRERAQKGTEKSSPTKKPRSELSKAQYNASSFDADERKRGSVSLGARTSSEAVGQDEYRAKAQTTSTVLSSEAGRLSAKKSSSALFDAASGSRDGAKSPSADDVTRQRRGSQRSIRLPEDGDSAKALKRLSQPEQLQRPIPSATFSGSGSGTGTPKHAGSTSASPTTSQGQSDRISKLKPADSESSSSMSSSRPNLGVGLSLVRKAKTETEWARSVSTLLDQVAEDFVELYQQDALDALRAVLDNLKTGRSVSKTSLLEAARRLEKVPRDYLELVCEAEKDDRRMPANLSLFMRQLFQAIKDLKDEESLAIQRQGEAVASAPDGALSTPNTKQQ